MWSKAFLVKALETALVTGASTFAAAQVFTTTPSWKGLVAAATAAGVATVYSFVKQLGGVQALKAAGVTK